MKEERHPLEWAVLAVAAVVVLLTLGFLIHQGFEAKEGELPVFRVTVGNVTAQRVVRVRVENQGVVTAEFIKVEVSSGDEKIEFELDRLAGGAHHEGHVIFEEPPSEVRARVTTFQLP